MHPLIVKFPFQACLHAFKGEPYFLDIQKERLITQEVIALFESLKLPFSFHEVLIKKTRQETTGKKAKNKIDLLGT